MGLACSNIRLLTLTTRKADCEYNISIDSIEKMALLREQSKLSDEYYSRLQGKQIAYYANGKYSMINYNYLMGYGSNFTHILDGTAALKNQNSTILTDAGGAVVLSDEYANAIIGVLGNSIMDENGRGGTFSVNDVPKILAKLLDSFATEEEIKAVHEEGEVEAYSVADEYGTISKTATGNSSVIDNTAANTEKIKKVVDFYWPIFQAAAANGWTTEYNKEMSSNNNYISDALNTGFLQLATVQCDGGYDPETSLTYFVTNGLVYERTELLGIMLKKTEYQKKKLG